RRRREITNLGALASTQGKHDAAFVAGVTFESGTAGFLIGASNETRSSLNCSVGDCGAAHERGYGLARERYGLGVPRWRTAGLYLRTWLGTPLRKGMPRPTDATTSCERVLWNTVRNRTGENGKNCRKHKEPHALDHFEPRSWAANAVVLTQVLCQTADPWRNLPAALGTNVKLLRDNVIEKLQRERIELRSGSE